VGDVFLWRVGFPNLENKYGNMFPKFGGGFLMGGDATGVVCGWVDGEVQIRPNVVRLCGVPMEQ
jgi:hypothetical protein